MRKRVMVLSMLLIHPQRFHVTDSNDERAVVIVGIVIDPVLQIDDAQLVPQVKRQARVLQDVLKAPANISFYYGVKYVMVLPSYRYTPKDPNQIFPSKSSKMQIICSESLSDSASVVLLLKDDAAL